MTRKLTYDHRILFLAILAGVPGSLVALVLLWFGNYTPKVQWTFTVLIFLFWLSFAFALRERVVRPLQTLSNLLAGLREGDYSVRARRARGDDALGEVFWEVNSLVEVLREQRLGALEATNLLRSVMAEIDVAVFTFDGEQRLRLVNRAGERFLAQPRERLLGHSAAELGLADCLQGETPRTAQMNFPGGVGRWGIRRTTFREGGLPHQLLVLSDLSRELREEERQAWQRLVRVLGHELNNSLAPIKSIAGSLRSLINRQPPPADWKEDLNRGLEVVATRAESLNRFMGSYTQLARLPPPRLQEVEVSALVRRVVELETRMRVTLGAGPALVLRADTDQVEQLLINLLRNAVDAVLESKGPSTPPASSPLKADGRRDATVSIEWTKTGSYLELRVDDDGPGLSNTANLFVPFFTTKPNGTGIGLVLSRQIAEAHGGALMLENKSAGHGCIARLRLPLG